ncbi:hypothetical protein BJ875DRAFT_51174 [Amylocarpus encephaloides]|uniref:Uncharacterized protein n=1 Tax=Amylocarpus encephaloides TaxID=45428 RepID=A0A9P7YH06_9HELO|nr:hypothetical protein BJ875DRAFT_51174 [Amylocarpus encephaloides]
MRRIILLYLLSITIEVAKAGTHAIEGDYNWRNGALGRDSTANDYREHGEALPKVAESITTVEGGRSYTARLECLGCSSRVRMPPAGEEVYETWREVDQENSLLLNFTMATSKRCLLLDGEQIFPLGKRPPKSFAFQIPSNISADTLDMMISMDMIDEYWQLSAKFDNYVLSYELTAMRTEDSSHVLQFDVKHITGKQGINNISAALDQPNQKIVQITLGGGLYNGEMDVKRVELVGRVDEILSTKLMGKETSIFHAKFNPAEWDDFGRFGTWERTFYIFLRWIDRFVADCFPVIILFIIVVFIAFPIRWCVIMSRRSNCSRASEPATSRFKDEDLKLTLGKGEA